MRTRRFTLLILFAVFGGAARGQSFPPDASPVPATHPALAPTDDSIATTNPPSLIWRHDATAESYVVEFSPTHDFAHGVRRVERIALPFYNHDAPLALGTWYWRYFVVRPGGAISTPAPARSFRITPASTPLPVPSGPVLLANLPAHPRIFVRPEDLASFRQRRLGLGQEAWALIKAKADAVLAIQPALPALSPMPTTLPAHRQQVFRVEGGVGFVPAGYGRAELARDAERANLLSLAYLISGDEVYADAARQWALFVAPFRLDYHLKTVAERGQHDSVVYAYEKGVTAIAFTFDRIAARLSAGERRALLDHVEYHGEAAYHWIRHVIRVHLDYQESHGQQCMHALLSTALAVAGDSAKAGEWLTYLVPQYANRIAWMSDDGGYFEGQSYSFKFTYILEALAALRTATGIDIFRKPAIRNAGDFWLYCMSLNYWWPHWGDNLPLINPYGNMGDAYLSALLAASTGNRPLQWWSEAVPADPAIVPFSYLSATGVRPQPPVAVAQARAFPDTGVVAAFDRFYDHGGTRMFFRSSPWGGHSHAHADQNSFVLHAGGEILAADVGYYTYYMDEHHAQISTQTIGHNSVLVDGKGQTKDLAGHGAISAFFNSPGAAYFAGDASHSYGEALDRFNRDVLYLRPGLFVIADELRAATPRVWSWVLNTFEAPMIDQSNREFVVAQRGVRLWGRQVFPEALRYTSSNDRKYPLLTRRWARYTEAFPEPWRLLVETEKIVQTNFLTVLQAYAERDGAHVAVAKSLEQKNTLAIRLESSAGAHDILMRRRQEAAEALDVWGFNCDGRAFVLHRDLDGRVRGWWAICAQNAAVSGQTYFHSGAAASVAVDLGTAAAAVQLVVDATRSTEVAITLPQKPKRLAALVLNRAALGPDVAFRWENGMVRFVVPEGITTFWVDPTISPSRLPTAVTFAVSDGAGVRDVACETAIAENGDWIAYATVEPRSPGIYEVSSSAPKTEILLQDRWDMERTTRGLGRATGLICQGTQVILRFPPDEKSPDFAAKLVEPRPAATINLLRNGDCEAGIPHFPPRGWTVRHGSTGEYATSGQHGWVEWSGEQAASGKASLKFTRPLNRIIDWRAPYNEVGRDTMTACAPPVRLLRGGSYVLTLKARGNATHARVMLSGGADPARMINLEPSPDWRGYRIEASLPPGYTEVKIQCRAGGADDQVLWVDDVSLTPAGG